MKKYIAFPKTTDHSSSTSVSALLPHRTISGVIHHRLVRGAGHGAVGGDVVVDEHRCRDVGTGGEERIPSPPHILADQLTLSELGKQIWDNATYINVCTSRYSYLPTALTEASQGGSELDQGCWVGQKVWLKVRFLKGPRRFYKVSYTKVEIFWESHHNLKIPNSIWVIFM